MKNIYRHTKFASNPLGDGGDKRTAQIKEILDHEDILFEDVELNFKKRSGILNNICSIWSALLFAVRHFSYKEILNYKLLIFTKYIALRKFEFEQKFQNKDFIFLWESTVPGNMIFPYILKSQNRKIIALPHNLESLVPEQPDPISGKKNWLADEIKRLALCDAVFCISREEYWLLRTHGLNAFYLPYYPPAAFEKELLDIRNIRLSRPAQAKRKFLLLGSATNPPTFNGMKEFITEFKTAISDTEILIGGYSTEKLKDFIKKDSAVTLLGTLSKEQLKDVLTEIDALIIYQQPTSGALTRVVEMLVAGIPVIMNEDSARSYYDMPGSVLYKDLEELRNLLPGFEMFEVPVPDKPSRYYSQFTEVVGQMMY